MWQTSAPFSPSSLDLLTAEWNLKAPCCWYKLYYQIKITRCPLSHSKFGSHPAVASAQKASRYLSCVSRNSIGNLIKSNCPQHAIVGWWCSSFGQTRIQVNGLERCGAFCLRFNGLCRWPSRCSNGIHGRRLEKSAIGVDLPAPCPTTLPSMK